MAQVVMHDHEAEAETRSRHLDVPVLHVAVPCRKTDMLNACRRVWIRPHVAGSLARGQARPDLNVSRSVHDPVAGETRP